MSNPFKYKIPFIGSSEYDFTGDEARELLERDAAEQSQLRERLELEEYISQPLGAVSVELCYEN